MVNDLVTNFLEESEGSEWNADEDVFSNSAISAFVLNPVDRVHKDEASELTQVSVGLLKLDERFGSLFFNFSNLDLFLMIS